jgi:hypothetical protein
LGPGSRSASNNLSILNPKKLLLISQKSNPGCSSRIRILISYILDPGVKKALDPGSGMNIPDRIAERLETVFGLRKLKSFDAGLKYFQHCHDGYHLYRKT